MPCAAQHALGPLPHLLGARRHEVVRERQLRVRGGRVDRGLAELVLDRVLLRVLELVLDVGAQLVDGVELARLGGEVVVQLGQLLALHVLHVDVERGLPALELLGLVLVGELHLDHARVARARAHELLLEALDQPPAAELEHVVAGLAALELLAVDLAHEVDHDVVPLLGRAFDAVQPRERLPQPVELGLDRLLGHLGLAAADLEVLVAPQLCPRGRADLDREAQRLAGGRQLGQVQLRVADGRDARAHDRLLVPLRQRVAHRLLEHRLAPHALDHHRGRHLALPEARELQLATEGGGRALEARLDLLARHLGVEAHAGVG